MVVENIDERDEAQDLAQCPLPETFHRHQLDHGEAAAKAQPEYRCKGGEARHAGGELKARFAELEQLAPALLQRDEVVVLDMEIEDSAPRPDVEIYVRTWCWWCWWCWWCRCCSLYFI